MGKVLKTKPVQKVTGKVLKTKLGKKTRSDPKLKEKMSKIDPELLVWVGGMAEETTAGQLRRHFTEAGCKPHLVNLTGKDRAALSFKTADEALSAISALAGTELDGSALEVD